MTDTHWFAQSSGYQAKGELEFALKRVRCATFPDAVLVNSHLPLALNNMNSDSGSLHHERLIAYNRDQAESYPSTADVDRVGIVGAGLMGSSIAENCIRAGKQVLLLDANHDAARAAVAAIKSNHPDAIIEQILSYDRMNEVDLVIESVVETIEVKKIVLNQILNSIGSSTLVATNTSAIPLAKMIPFVDQPKRFCGIHFCHPELMSLVEVVRATQTSDQTLASAVQFVISLNKMPVVVNDCAGFVVNRLLAAMIDQSVRLLMSGTSIEQIDGAMQDFGFQGGPFEIMDVIGIDTCMYAGRTMWEAGLECVSLSPILPRLVKKQRLGRKTKAGFYHYETLRGDAISDPDLPPMIESYVEDAGANLSPSDICNQILAAITREASLILADGIVADPHEIDLCIIHGFSFPSQRGGILFWADQFGLSNVIETLEAIAAREPRLSPPQALKTMAREGKSFYAN